MDLSINISPPQFTVWCPLHNHNKNVSVLTEGSGQLLVGKLIQSNKGGCILMSVVYKNISCKWKPQK